MNLFTRIAVVLVVATLVTGVPSLLAQREGGPGRQGRQGGAAEAQGRQGGPTEAQGRGRPGGPAGTPRDRPPARTGTASIRGRVISATTGMPVRRASIVASYVNEQGRNESGRNVTTDDNGAFELASLAAGRWTLRASKTGYVEQQFGQRSAFSTADPITLADAQRFVADFRLTRGGAISGRIVDEFGDPVAGANVSALRLQAAAQGVRTSRAGTSVPSDDTGAYRIYGLPPGQYYVSVNDPSAARMVVLSQDGGSFSIDVGAVAADARAAFEQVLLRASETRTTSYAPTYYPGTANITDAQRVTLGLGQEQSGISLAIVPVRAARITGRVMGSNGMPLRAQVSLISPLGQGFNSGGGRNGTGTDGSFTLNNIPPGTYTLNVLGPSVGAAPPDVASMPLVVNGEDIVDLTIVAGSGARIQGTLVPESGGRLPASRVRVTAAPVQSTPASWTPRADVSENGTFVLEGLAGVYVMRVESLPAGWIVKSITANGIDVSDAAIEFQPSDRVSLRVELTDRVTQVSGTVRATRDIGGGTVVVFADEPSRWTSTSRFVKTARVSEDGRFSISGLPPHSRYLAMAVDFIEAGEAQNPEFLQRAKALAPASFGLAAGGQHVLDLQLVVR